MALPEVKVRITADDSGLERGISRAENKLSSFAKFGIRAAATALAALPTGFVLASRAAINFADEMAKTSQRIGLTTEALSKLQYAAKLSDVSLSDLRVGLSQLARNMDMNSDAFERLGVTIRNQDGSLRDTEAVFTDLVQRFSMMQDGAQKTALAMEIFGRSGANMIPLLNAGAAGLKAMTDQADQFGLTVSTKAGKQAEQFNDNLTRLFSIIQGVVNKITSAMLPALVSFSDKLVDIATSMSNSLAEASNMQMVTDALTISMKIAATAVAAFGSALRLAAINMVTLVDVSKKLISLDLKGAFESLKAGAQDVLANARETVDAYIKIWSEAEKQIRSQPATVTVGGNFFVPQDAPSKDDEKKAKELETLRGQLETRLQFLRESLMTERELLQSEYAEQQTLLVDALNQKLMSETEYAQRRKQLEERLQDDLAKLDGIRRQQALGATATLFGGLAQLAQLGGKKLFNIAKAFSIAEAVMNTAQAVTKSLTSLPFPFNLAAAAGTAAAGAAQIATIAATQPGGGGGGIKAPSASGGAGAAAAPAAAAPAAGGGRPTQVALQLTGGDLFGRDQVISLINAINEAQEDGAVVRLV